MAGDVARGRGTAGAATRAALAHADTCAECAALLASERVVAEALAALAASVQGRGAPARVEAALLEAFARRGEGAGRARVRWRWISGLAAAAALAGIVAGAAAWMRYSRVAEPPLPPAAHVLPAPAAVVAPRAIPPAPPAVARHTARVRPRPRAHAARPAPAPVREVATRFYPLRYGESGAEAARGPVLRVQVPRVTLVSFGLPMDQNRADEPVQADVALDETGFARAIRFVREQ
ncbi:MAG TPA: hypothetical protein VHA11_13425 [Bryobacteraceae bacterium]|nr:hypothetical protein [Bryobacteraceae bacterium]